MSREQIYIRATRASVSKVSSFVGRVSCGKSSEEVNICARRASVTKRCCHSEGMYLDVKSSEEVNVCAIIGSVRKRCCHSECTCPM